MNGTNDSYNNEGFVPNAESYSHEIHWGILVVTMTVSCVLLFENTCIVVCFIVNRRKTWPTFVAQIFCLSFSDLFVGLAMVPWVILPVVKSDEVQVSIMWCSMMLYMLIVSQCGSLYHILTICAHRCFRIETSTRPSDPQSCRKTPYVFALLSWAVSFVLVSIPFMIWTNTEGTLYSCLLHEVFLDIKSAMGLVGIILFLPQGLTNVLYLIACLRLRHIWRRVMPVQSINASVQSTTTSSGPRPATRTTLRVQWRFLGTIGIIMLLFNICTLPLIALTILENNHYMMNREFRYSAATCFMLNSALNPFIYAFRSQWLKTELKRLFGSI